MADVQKIHVATGIFAKYKPEVQLGAEHDWLVVYDIYPDDMTDADVTELRMLGWEFDPTLPGWSLQL